MTLIRKRNEMPDKAKLVLDLIEEFGFKEAAYLNTEMVHPNPEDRIQIRAEKHNCPREEVNKLAASMQRGDKFPPVVISKDGYIVDGNTRIAASMKNKYRSISGFVLDVNWKNASDSVRQRFWGLGTAFNASNGKGIDRNEIRRSIEFMSQNDTYDVQRIAKLLRVTDATVRNILAEKRVRERAKEIGINVNGEMAPSTARRIGQANASLNDGPFKSLVELARDAALSAAEANALIKAIREAKSDEDAQAILLKERQNRSEQIAERRVTGKKPKLPLSVKLRKSFELLLDPQHDLDDFVETSPVYQKIMIKKIDEYVSFLDRLRTLQLKKNNLYSEDSHAASA